VFLSCGRNDLDGLKSFAPYDVRKYPIGYPFCLW
jgi:hypothetical protein